MSRSRARGTKAETQLVGWLREHGWPNAERRALRGAKDCGDVAGMPGLVVEVKDVREPAWGAWLDETEVERVNAHADYGLLVRRRVGKPDPGDWYAVLPLRAAARLLRTVGYGTPVEEDAA